MTGKSLPTTGFGSAGGGEKRSTKLAVPAGGALLARASAAHASGARLARRWQRSLASRRRVGINLAGERIVWSER